eukprot:9232106-Pyramimonas_sp.AAC.1
MPWTIPRPVSDESNTWAVELHGRRRLVRAKRTKDDSHSHSRAADCHRRTFCLQCALAKR